MGLLEKMGQFIHPENKLVEDAKEIIEEKSIEQAREFHESEEKQREVIGKAWGILGEEGYKEIKAVSENLRSLSEKGTEKHEMAIKALMDDYGWSEIMANQRLLIILNAFEELGRGGFEPPDEADIHEEDSNTSTTRDTRSMIHEIVSRDYGPAIAMDVDPLIDTIVADKIKNYN